MSNNNRKGQYSRLSRARPLRHRSEAGQSLVEFALVLPVLLLLLLGIIQFGAVFNSLITLNAAAREGARTMAAENNQDSAKAAAAALCAAAPFLSCDDEDIVVTDKDINPVEVTVMGRVPVFLFIFSESELTLAGKSIMRLEPQINED